MAKTSMDAKIAANLRDKGFPFTAEYVERFGAEGMNPAYSRGPSKGSEEFYKKCVTEGHPWDWYFEFPDDAVF